MENCSFRREDKELEKQKVVGKGEPLYQGESERLSVFFVRSDTDGLFDF